MKYCCLDFEVHSTMPSTTAPNIRIVKYLPMPQFDGKLNFGFYITIGYEKFSINLPKLNLKYCPSCGQKLKSFYKSDKYLNEIEGETF